MDDRPVPPGPRPLDPEPDEEQAWIDDADAWDDAQAAALEDQAQDSHTYRYLGRLAEPLELGSGRRIKAGAKVWTGPAPDPGRP